MDAIKSQTVERFSGINTVDPATRLFPVAMGHEYVYPLQQALNVEIDNSFEISSRGGCVLALMGTDIHSLWADGDVCFYADANILYKVTGQTPVVIEGSAALPDIKLSLAPGTAFLDIGADVFASYIGYSITVKDSAGKKAVGFIAAVGAGETYGAELLTSWSNGLALPYDAFISSGSTITLVVQTIPKACLAWANYPFPFTDGGIYRHSFIVNPVAGDLPTIVYGAKQTSPADSINPIIQIVDANGPNVKYFTASGVQAGLAYAGLKMDGVAIISSGVSATSFGISVQSMKQVLSPASTGVMISSTRNGSVQSWSSVDYGFNPNDANGYTYEISISPLFDATFKIASMRDDLVSGARLSYVNVNDRTYYTNYYQIGYIKDNADNELPDPGREFKQPLPAGQLIEYFLGCIYVARDNILYISDPLCDYYDTRHGYRIFKDRITLLRRINEDGIYVADSEVWFAKGKGNEDFERANVYPKAAIPFTDVTVLGELVDENLKGDVILFTAEDGICMGDGSGQITNLTQSRFTFDPHGRGTGFVREKGNIRHYINSLY